MANPIFDSDYVEVSTIFAKFFCTIHLKTAMLKCPPTGENLKKHKILALQICNPGCTRCDEVIMHKNAANNHTSVN